ncbi:MAG: hypothetical protein JWP25_2777 [Bradyrhizobium sp.]|jgi:hypothetical protein|nr:hypothetical protein [Bradyrhizobium sp.]
MIMRQSDVTCPKCHGGYRRIELVSRKGSKGEFQCESCDEVLEVFDGSTYVAIRPRVQPRKAVRVSHSFGKGLAGLSSRDPKDPAPRREDHASWDMGRAVIAA